jgi:hypothetical protein
MAVSYTPRNEATSDLFYYIAVFYNRSRRHSTLWIPVTDHVPAELDRTTGSARNGSMRTASWKAKNGGYLNMRAYAERAF